MHPYSSKIYDFITLLFPQSLFSRQLKTRESPFRTYYDINRYFNSRSLQTLEKVQFFTPESNSQASRYVEIQILSQPLTYLGCEEWGNKYQLFGRKSNFHTRVYTYTHTHKHTHTHTHTHTQTERETHTHTHTHLKTRRGTSSQTIYLTDMQQTYISDITIKGQRHNTKYAHFFQNFYIIQ